MSADRKRIDGWLVASHGIYPYREVYDEGPDGDNWSYIDTSTLCIVHFRPINDNKPVPNTKATIISGPFPNLEAAKAAYLVIYGSNRNER